MSFDIFEIGEEESTPKTPKPSRRKSRKAAPTDDPPLVLPAAFSFPSRPAPVSTSPLLSTPPPPPRDYLDIAESYVDDILSERIASSRWVRLGCERHRADLDRAGSSDFPYVLDESRARKACEAIERLPHVKGAWARRKELITLEPWQVFFVVSLFGWINPSTALRRFVEAYLEVARKNAKTTLAAAIGAYMLGPEGEPGAEVYSAAAVADQSRICLDLARTMLRKSPNYLAAYDAEVREHIIYSDHRNSKFDFVSREADNLDGKNPSFIIFDELHAHPNRLTYDVLTTGQGSRDQPLAMSITTAGVDSSGICKEVRSFTENVLDGKTVAENHFGMIYCLDEDDRESWADSKLWIKANPNLGVSVYPSSLESAAKKAKETPSSLNAFLTKRCCLWTSASSDWIPGPRWAACADRSLSIEDFRGDPMILAVDLASTRDLCALAGLFYRDDRYALFGKCYVPEARAKSSGYEHYAGWVEEGYLEATPGETHKHGRIKSDILSLAANYRIHKVGYDKYQAHALATELEEEGLEPWEIPQSRAMMSEPMREMEDLVFTDRLVHSGNPCHDWQLLNVLAEKDTQDRMRPTRLNDESKIDFAVAALMAFCIELRFPLASVKPKRRRFGKIPMVRVA